MAPQAMPQHHRRALKKTRDLKEGMRPARRRRTRQGYVRGRPAEQEQVEQAGVLLLRLISWTGRGPFERTCSGLKSKPAAPRLTVVSRMVVFCECRSRKRHKFSCLMWLGRRGELETAITSQLWRCQQRRRVFSFV